VCGFFQVFQRGVPIDRRRFDEAFALIRHRGPDFSATVAHAPIRLDGAHCPEIHCVSGHHRLSILDLDARSNQPFQRERATLLFNGEIYNYRDVRRSPTLASRNFTTSGDTETLFEGLCAVGEEILNACNGMWAFSFLDAGAGRLLAARDRYGKKPLFYHLGEDVICISSTIAPICHYLGVRPRLRRWATDAFLVYGIMWPQAGSQTQVEPVSEVAPGGSVSFDLRAWTAQPRAWDHFDPHDAGDASPAELPQLLSMAVSGRLISDREVGLLLSGGVDSSAVLSAMHAAGLTDRVHCFIGDTGKSDDAEYAKRSAQAVGIKPEIINLSYGLETFERFLKICRHQEKGFPLGGNAMAMSEMYEAIASYGVPVVLDGTGGDEIFGGYWDRHFRHALRDAWYARDLAWLRGNLAGSHEKPRLRRELYRTINPFAAASLRARLRRRFSPVHRALGLHRLDLPTPDPLEHLRSGLTDALYRDTLSGGRLGEWLWQNDRNAMMYGIENRSPLLDYRLRKYMATPYHRKLREGWNKHELRTALDGLTPLPTQWRRQKQGFRWSSLRFLEENRSKILELIGGASALRTRLDVDRYLDLVRPGGKPYRSALTARLLCLAGLEETLGMTFE
jgi:asparagine synthase (glutamine-hydrolysing)